jgi:hypothetical protein
LFFHSLFLDELREGEGGGEEKRTSGIRRVGGKKGEGNFLNKVPPLQPKNINKTKNNFFRFCTVDQGKQLTINIYIICYSYLFFKNIANYYA